MTQVGFCVISPCSLSRFISNHRKALLRCLLHLHSNFQLLPLSGLPCRRDSKSILFYANNRSYLQNHSSDLHQIDARIRLWTPFQCAKFQGNRITRLRFIAIFASVQKHEEKKKIKKLKNQEKKSKLWKLVSRKWQERFPSNLECRLPWLAGNSVGSNRIRDHRDTKVWKWCFLSSCKYTHGVAHRLLGPYDTSVCLDV